jgi:zinc protease
MRSVKWTLALVLLATTAIGFAQKPEPPDPAPLGNVDFPAYQTRKLPNGLTVYAIEHREQPVVSIRLLIAAGAAADPADLPGVASFTADLLMQGTTSRDATALAQAAEEVGGTIEASADMESTTIGASFLKENVNLAFELVTDMVRNPAFEVDEVGRLRQQSLSGLAAALEDPDFVADAVLERALYGAHAYGHPEDGTLDSLQSMNQEAVRKFHQTYYAPNISALAVAGDLSPNEIFALAERHFGSWPQKNVPATATSFTAPATKQRKIVVIDKPDAVQTEIRVAKRIVPRKDPNYFNLLLGSLVLGGSAEGRLNQRLRVERGLTYGAYASIRPRRGPSSFYSLTETRTEKTGEALNLILEEIANLRTANVPEQELTEAKALIIGGFPLSIEVPADLTSRLNTVFLYDLGDDYLKTYRDRIAAVTPADVMRVSREWLQDDDVVIVMVGQAAEFKTTIESLGNVEVIPADKLDLGSPALQ